MFCSLSACSSDGNRMFQTRWHRSKGKAPLKEGFAMLCQTRKLPLFGHLLSEAIMLVQHAVVMCIESPPDNHRDARDQSSR